MVKFSFQCWTFQIYSFGKQFHCWISPDGFPLACQMHLTSASVLRGSWEYIWLSLLQVKVQTEWETVTAEKSPNNESIWLVACSHLVFKFSVTFFFVCINGRDQWVFSLFVWGSLALARLTYQNLSTVLSNICPNYNAQLLLKRQFAFLELRRVLILKITSKKRINCPLFKYILGRRLKWQGLKSFMAAHFNPLTSRVIQSFSNFWFYGQNPKVWPFTGKLLSSSLLCCCLLTLWLQEWNLGWYKVFLTLYHILWTEPQSMTIHRKAAEQHLFFSSIYPLCNFGLGTVRSERVTDALPALTP